MPIPDTPTAWHNQHDIQLITDPKKPDQIIIQIKETNTEYPINEIDRLIQCLQTIKHNTA